MSKKPNHKSTSVDTGNFSHPSYDNYISACKQLLMYLQRHRELKDIRDKEWHKRLRSYRLQHGDWYAKDPRTGEPMRNRAGNKILLRCPEFKKAQQLYNWIVNHLEQIINGNFQNVGKSMRRKYIAEPQRSLDLTLVERQVDTGLDDMRLKLGVMKDQYKEYKTYQELENEYLFVMDGKRIATDQYGNIVAFPIEPMTYDWLDDTRMVLENVNELFITLAANPRVKEFDVDSVISEALGE